MRTWDWPLPGSVVATFLMLRGAWALWKDFRRWERALSAESDRLARGEFVTESTRLALPAGTAGVVPHYRS